MASARCEEASERMIRNVPVSEIHAGEIRSFIGKNKKRVKAGDDPAMRRMAEFYGTLLQAGSWGLACKVVVWRRSICGGNPLFGSAPQQVWPKGSRRLGNVPD